MESRYKFDHHSFSSSIYPRRTVGDLGPTMKIDFGQFVKASSDTIDLVGVDEIQHGNLGSESLAIMRHHSFVTHTILNRIGGLEEIALWASNHHEKLDGSGYPFRRIVDETGIESRIVMVVERLVAS